MSDLLKYKSASSQSYTLTTTNNTSIEIELDLLPTDATDVIFAFYYSTNNMRYYVWFPADFFNVIGNVQSSISNGYYIRVTTLDLSAKKYKLTFINPDETSTDINYTVSISYR